MFTITNKIRAIIALSAVGAALGSAGVASAALPVHQLGTVTTTLRAPSRAIALDPQKVGDAGVPGYDTATCENLAKQYNGFEAAAENVYEVNPELGQQLDLSAQDIYAEVESNCIIVD